MPEKLLTNALWQALRACSCTLAGAANTCRALLDQYGCPRSQSRRAECPERW